MTLEKTISPAILVKNNLNSDTSSDKRKLVRSLNSSKSQTTTGYSKLGRDNSNIKVHESLDQRVSDNTHLTTSSITGISQKGWVSTNYLDRYEERKHRSKVKYGSSNNVSQTHKLPSGRNNRTFNSNSTNQLSVSDRRNSSSTKDQVSSTPEVAEVAVNSTTCSREPSTELSPLMPRPSGHSTRASAANRSEKKEPTPSNNGLKLRALPSWSGQDSSSLKENRPHSADARPRESTSCSFFYFIRRKKKNSSGSPSPNTRDTKSNRHKFRGLSSISCSSAQSGLKPERTPSPSDKGRRPSGQSLTSSRVALTSISSNPPASVTSPSAPLLSSPSQPTTDKQQKYTSRSRSKHRRDRRRHRANKRAVRAHPDDQLRHEDLPPHPSLYRKAVEKTSSEPILHSKPSYNISSSSSNVVSTSNNKTNSQSETFSRSRNNSETHSRKNSKQESVNLTTSAVVNPQSERSQSSGHNQKELNEESALIPEKSQQSTSKTDLEYTTSNSDLPSRRSVRSQSLPSFRGELFVPIADTKVISDAEDFEFDPTDMQGTLHLSLAGCGFLGMYHLGVVSCLSLRGLSFLDRLEKVAGASAGALMAAVLVTARDKIEESADHIQNLAKEMRRKPLGALTPGYSFTRSLRYMLEDILPEDAHETAQGRLFVSLTNADTKQNEMLSDFKSRDELIEVLVASCYIPVYAGIKPPAVRGKKYIDGGLSDNLPRFETGRTITVSPFDGKSDIGPKQSQEVDKKAHFINVHNQDIQVSVNNIKKGTHALFPPKRQTLQEYFEKGRYDASRFLIREGLYEIGQSPQKKNVLYESSV